MAMVMILSLVSATPPPALSYTLLAATVAMKPQKQHASACLNASGVPGGSCLSEVVRLRDRTRACASLSLRFIALRGRE